MDLHLDIDAPRSDEYTRQVANGFAEAMRVLNHHTFASASMDGPSTVYSVLGNVRAALNGLGQLLGQLSDRLATFEATGRLYDDRDHMDADLAARTVATVRQYLLAGQVGAAHSEAARLGLLDEERPNV